MTRPAIDDLPSALLPRACRSPRARVTPSHQFMQIRRNPVSISLTPPSRFGVLPARAARHDKAPVAQLDRASDYGSEG